MKKYIYCYDEDTKEKLIKRGFRLMNTHLTSEENIYVFKNDASLFTKDFSYESIRQFCCFDNKLKMNF